MHPGFEFLLIQEESNRTGVCQESTQPGMSIGEVEASLETNGDAHKALLIISGSSSASHQRTGMSSTSMHRVGEEGLTLRISSMRNRLVRLTIWVSRTSTFLGFSRYSQGR